MKKIKLLLVKVFKIGILTAIMGFTIYGGYMLGEVRTYTISAETIDSSPAKIQIRITELKNEIVEGLAKCESGNVSQDVGLIVYDNNKKGTLKGKHIPSHGVMQYKSETAQRHYKGVYGTEISNYDAIILALTNDKAKELAGEAIVKIEGSLWEWTCATKDMGIKVELIRELKKLI